MPRQRQRIVFCDCFDCRDRPEVSLTPEQLDAATAVARQEPPPKALLLYATGFVVAADGATNLDACTLPHCNLVVREGNLGLLAVRAADETAAQGPGAAVSELAQLLGAYQEFAGSQLLSAEGGDGSLPSLAARFKGMQAAFASTSAAARRLAQRLGMAVVERLSLGTASGHSEQDAAAAAAAGLATGGTDGAQAAAGRGCRGLPDAADFAGAVSAELGAADGSSGRDLLLLHLDLDDLRGRYTGAAPEAPGADAEAEVPGQAPGAAAPGAAAASNADGDAEAEAEARWDAGCEGLEWLDALVKALLARTEIRERTLLVLMLSPAGRKLPGVAGQGGVGGGGVAGGGALLQPGGAQMDPAAAVVTPRSLAQLGRGGGAAPAAAAAGAFALLDAPNFPLVSRPMQSFELLGMARVETDPHAPVLVARRLPGVVRRDRAERLTYKEVVTAGAMGVILVDRLLPDVAYKIGRAPKYGA